METLLQDLRFAVRGLRKHPGFAFVAVLTLALGIGANTAVFSVVDASLVKPLPYREPDRLVHLWELRPERQFPRSEASYPDYVDFAASTRTLEEIAGYAGGGSMTMTGGGRPERLSGLRVTANFFDLLGVAPAIGRAFRPGDDAAGAERLVVIGHDLWRRRFGADPSVVGRTIVLDETPHTIAGVLPKGFHFARSRDAEIWTPLVPSPNERERRRFRWLNLVGRLAPGASVEQVDAELDAVAARLGEQYPDSNAGSEVEVIPLREELVGPVRPLLAVLLGAVGLVLLIACANVASLLVARSATRRREIAVRRALGASNGRIARQLLVEGTVLALAGGAAGALWTQWGVALLVGAIPEPLLASMPYLRDVSLDARALGFALAISLGTGLLFSLAPALHATGVGLHEALKERAATAGGGRARLRAALVVSEVALSLVLLVGAGLMVQSLARLLATDPGFETERLLTFQVSLPEERYGEPARVEALHQGLMERLTSTPGVRGAASTDKLPLSGGGGTGSFVVQGLATTPPDLEYEANMRTVSSDYFRVMEIPLVAGRPFEDRDRVESAPVVVVNRALAARLAADGNVVGARIVFSFDRQRIPREIVGVVGDENLTGLDAELTPIAYTPYLQDLLPYWSAVVRTTGEPEALAATVERELRALDPDLPAYAVAPMERLIADAPSTFLRSYPALLIGALAAVALALSVVGIFGVVSYSVSQRTREIGIRVALGAGRREILGMVLGQGLALVGAGVAIGVVVALVGSRFLSSLLFGISPSDPATYAGVAVLLASVALLACYVPARRATRVDPMVALREE
jgi:putative ABC transport system permease protein